MHPALYSWREQLPATLVRLLAYLGGITVLSIGAAYIIQSRPAIDPINAADRPQWVEIEKPFPAFVLAIPEAAGVPSHYTILRNRAGAGRKDILSLGEPDGTAPYLQVEVYRPGSEIRHFARPEAEIAKAAAGLGPAQLGRGEPLNSKKDSYVIYVISNQTDPIIVFRFKDLRITVRIYYGWLPICGLAAFIGLYFLLFRWL